MSLLLCKLRGKQPHKVRHKMLKVINPREKVKNVRGEQDTRYIILHSVPSYWFFQRKKMMRGDLGRPSRIGREQGKEIMSHWLPKPFSNTLAGVTESKSSSVLAKAEINDNDAAKIWKQVYQPTNIARWLQKTRQIDFEVRGRMRFNIAEFSASKDTWASGCLLQT